MDTKEEILKELARLYPDAGPALQFRTPYELLIAVMLSAQCTDERVNKVTKVLFREHDTPEKMLTLSQEELEKYIFSCGFYHNKAAHILSASRDILERFGGEVPSTREELETLAGVGRKTANVVYAFAFGGNAIAVDTHVFRVANRLSPPARRPSKWKRGSWRSSPNKIGRRRITGSSGTDEKSAIRRGLPAMFARSRPSAPILQRRRARCSPRKKTHKISPPAQAFGGRSFHGRRSIFCAFRPTFSGRARGKAGASCGMHLNGRRACRRGGSARLLRCRPPRGAYLSCGGHAMKRGKGMLSARDTLRFLLQAEEEVLRRYLGALLAAGSRALRTELLPLFSSALEDRAALKELLSRVSPEAAEGRKELLSLAKKAQKELSALTEEEGADL